MSRKAWLLLTLLALVVAFAWQGMRGLSDPDEGRYAEVAREMLASGDVLHPQLEGHPHYTKPPLSYWAIAAGLRVLGPNEWAVRLFQSVAYAATILLVALTASSLWGRSSGILAGVIYSTFLLPFVAASIVTTDTLLTLWEALAVYAFFRGRRTPFSLSRWIFPALTGLAFGLAFLTKGPPALLFLLALIVWRFSPAGRKHSGAPVFSGLGWVLLLVTGLGWFIYVVTTTDGLMSYFLGEEVVGRIAGQHHRNAGWLGAVKIYLPILLLGALPWSVAWPVMWHRRRGLFALGHIWSRRPVLWALILLFAVPLAVFSLSRSRLPLYLLPLFIPLALATTRGLDGILGRDSKNLPQFWRRIRWRLSLSGWVLLLLTLRVGYARFPNEADARALVARLPVAEAREIVVTDGVRSVHGLAFYARRNLLHAAWSKNRAREEGRLSLKEVFDRLKRDSTASYLFLVKPDGVNDLRAMLAREGLSPQRELQGEKIVALLVGVGGTVP